jgi:hypothetical protein
MKASASHISKTISDSGMRRSVWHRGRVCGGMSEGYEVITAGSGAVCVRYNQRTAGLQSFESFLPTRNAKIAAIAELLTAKGYTVELVTEKIWDGNKTATFGYFYAGELRVTK